MRALLAMFALVIAIVPSAAQASANHGEARFFTDLYVPSGQTIDGDVNVVFGSVQVAGVVTGDCNVVFGDCEVVDGGAVLGSVHGFGGAAGGAAIAGQSDGERHLIARLLSNAVAVLLFLVFPLRTRLTLGRLEQRPALAALAGLACAVALIPLALLLLVSLVGIPLIAVEIAGTLAAVWIGTGAISLLVGRRICELLAPHTTPSPLPALLVGLIVVSSAEIVPIFGWAVTALVWLAGLGATVLSFARPGDPERLGLRAPIGGPPMSRTR